MNNSSKHNSRIGDYSVNNTAQTVAITDRFSIRRYKQFSRHLPNNATKVLDVGCAEGRGGEELKRLRPNIELSGLDCVKERLEQLPVCYVRGIHGLTNEIPLPDLSLDAIVAGEFLEHLYPSDVDPTLCEFQRILKIGGILMMTTPNPYSINMRRKGGSVYGTAHLTQHFSDVLRMRMMMHGFSRIKIRGSGHATRYFGESLPFLSIYGSYFISGYKV